MRLFPVLVAAVLAMALLAPAGASARVSPDFFGVFAESQLLVGLGLADTEYAAMREAGVGSVRTVVDWRTAQPYEDWAEVPEEERAHFRDERGVPTDWRESDASVGAAAEQGLLMLPVVQLAPPWAAKYPGLDNSPPAKPAPYARFVALLSRRYGPHGSFWEEHPELPRMAIRDFQIWNEPDFVVFWRDQPFERGYVRLLRASRRHLRRADRRARIVMAGISNYSWRTLRRLYARGARRHFDVAAVHPFSANVPRVLEIIRRARRVMERNGDRRKPIMVTEMSWTSAWGITTNPLGIETTEEDQADRVRQAYRRLLRKRRSLRIERAYWYTWLTYDREPSYSFDYAGLNRLHEDDRTVSRKPAYFSYLRVAHRAR